MPGRKKTLRKRALRIVQSSDTPIFMFSLSGRELLDIAEISRVSRNKVDRLIGYQRPEVKRHVKEIVEYLNSDNIVFPNSLILALSSDVKFVRSRGPQVDDGQAAAGTLEIPLPGPKGDKPAWIVDGQQRALALSKCGQPDLAVPITAFVGDQVALQRDQFLRINNTKPLPRGLITELLPEVSAPLPSRMAARQLPAAICEELNRDDSSPFKGLIRRTSTSKEARRGTVVSDNSVVKMIQESLSTPTGCLFPYRNITTGETDMEGIWGVLTVYWSAVAETFPDAWGQPASQSRLMHGAGIRSMGRLMDKIMSNIDPLTPRALRTVRQELAHVEPVCRWTRGRWEELGDLKWNEVQNTPGHVRRLSNVLIRAYVEARRAA